ncbi:hypothetical protein ACFLU1_04910 [Chloroflexota bacterium]
MILAALYFLVLISAAILLGILWLAYKGLVYLWQQMFRTDREVSHNEAEKMIIK